MKTEREENNPDKGKSAGLNEMFVDNHEISITGKKLRIASIRHDWNEDVEDPETMVKLLKKRPHKVDIFTFMQRLPESRPKYKYHMEWDNVAAIPIRSYDYWLKKQINQESRNKIRKAEKKGLRIVQVPFNEDLVKGIYEIYNETPIRQGKPFTHYGEDIETLTRIHETFLDHSYFIGAYFKDELIGFIKLVHAGRYIRTMHLLAMIRHRDKAPMNGLLAKAIEICCQKEAPYLVYGQFTYGKLGSDSLMDFKRFNGFEHIILPRYFVPLTVRGEIAIKLNVHNGFINIAPKRLVKSGLAMRRKWYEMKQGLAEATRGQ